MAVEITNAVLYRRHKKNTSAGSRFQGLLLKAVPAAFFFLTVPCFSALVFGADSAKIVSDANRFYLSDKYDQALKLYNQALIDSPDSAEINYNIGAANFKKADYEKAVESFEKALVTEDKILESKANYNIANSKYKLGKLKENTDLPATVRLLRESLDYYKRAIDLNSKDEDAKINHELVEKELKSLLDKLKQQQENQKQEQSQEDSNKQKKEERQQAQSGREKQGQGKEESNSREEESQSREQEKKEEETGKKEDDRQNQEAGEETKQGEKKEFSEAGESQEGSEQGELKEMSEEEAKMLLEGYRQEENAKGQIKDKRRGGYNREVSKDW